MQMKPKFKIGGIVQFYNGIADQLGFNHAECEYDCTKIEVSADIEEKIRSQYEDPQEFGMLWLVYGPKMNESLGSNTVELENGFIKKMEV